MLLMVLLLAHGLAIAYNMLWILLVGALVTSLGFLGLEMWELRRVGKCAPNGVPEVRDSTVVGGQTEKGEGMQMNKPHFLRLSKYESIITLATNKLVRVLKISSYLLQYSHSKPVSIPVASQQQNCDTKRENNGGVASKKEEKGLKGQTEKKQQLDGLRVQYISILRLKIVREFGFVILYAIFVGFVVVPGARDHGWNPIMLAQRFAQQFTLPYLIYLLPLILNTMWKLQRIYSYLMVAATPAPGSSTSPSILSEASSQIDTPHQQSIETILQLLQLQSFAQLFVAVYASVHCFVHVSSSFMIAAMEVVGEAVAMVEWGQFMGFVGEYVAIGVETYRDNFGQGGDALDWIRFGLNRLAVLFLALILILLRDAYSVGKPIGLRQSVWKAHMTMDKLIRTVSTDLRKQYHRKIFKMVKKLEKRKIIQFTGQQIHKSAYIELTVLAYYQCL